MAAPWQPIADRSIYLCTGDRTDLGAFVSACIRGGVDLVQLRDKHLEPRELLPRARLVQQICSDSGVPFVLNDRPDLAIEVEADGVHVGQSDAPPALARRIMGPEAIVGLSTHSPDDLEASTNEPVDYISAGPVEPTPTKPGRPGTGLSYISRTASTTTMPFFVTGGVTPARIPDLVAAGATRFVVVRYLTEAPDPAAAARSLRAAVDRALDGWYLAGNTLNNPAQINPAC